MALNRGWTYREQVGAEGAGLAILDHLAATHRHSTRQEWSERLDRGEVEVDGARVGGDACLRRGQVIAWHRPPWSEDDVPTTFTIVHVDDAIVVVNKPSGLPTMPAGGFLEHTLLTLVRRQFPEASPLHRLGRHTSGLVLFARTRAAAALLSREWRDRAVTKIYRALGNGVPLETRFAIDTPIGPVPHPSLGTVFAASPAGKPSHSVATTIESTDDRTLFSVEITTGRPHQVRIHLAYAGHPLVGDPLYESGGGVKRDPGLPGDGGYLLHAEQLQFTHPVTNTRLSIVATPPAALQTRNEQRASTVA